MSPADAEEYNRNKQIGMILTGTGSVLFGVLFSTCDRSNAIAFGFKVGGVSLTVLTICSRWDKHCLAMQITILLVALTNLILFGLVYNLTVLCLS